MAPSEHDLPPQTIGRSELAETATPVTTAEKDRTARVVIADPSLHHIVIVGGGAAGLELATKLGDSLGPFPLGLPSTGFNRAPT